MIKGRHTNIAQHDRAKELFKPASGVCTTRQMTEEEVARYGPKNEQIVQQPRIKRGNFNNFIR